MEQVLGRFLFISQMCNEAQNLLSEIAEKCSGTRENLSYCLLLIRVDYWLGLVQRPVPHTGRGM